MSELSQDGAKVTCSMLKIQGTRRLVRVRGVRGKETRWARQV